MATLHPVAAGSTANVVVFLHGVDGHWDNTWRSDAGMFWPEALATKTGWSVCSMAYEANTTWGRATMPLEDRAENLLDLLKAHPFITSACQIAIVAHSFGGLVAKAVVRKAWERRDWGLLDRLNAIVFLGTPHEGAGLATFLATIRLLVRATVTVDELQAHSPALRALANWYRDHHAEIGIRSLAFFETQPSNVGPVGTVVVDATSGTLTVAGARSVPIDANHFTICKPADQMQQQFISTELFLREAFQISSRLARLPRQYAAVCYRFGPTGLEFLLTHTIKARLWTFPKGRPDAGLAGFETARNEAYEEAGARGEVEREFFIAYLHEKRGVKRLKRENFAVHAYLMKVTDTEAPPEDGRDPAWFAPNDAKRALAYGREPQYAQELQGVIDAAVDRIAGATQRTGESPALRDNRTA